MARTIAHRELRNNSSQILQDVQAGESFEISNHGEVVAAIVPYSRHSGESLRKRPARLRGGFVDLARVNLDTTAQDSIDELRGDR